jgi:hypothetical protein
LSESVEQCIRSPLLASNVKLKAHYTNTSSPDATIVKAKMRSYLVLE